MKTVLLIWLISIVVWPILTYLYVFLTSLYRNIVGFPKSSIRQLAYDIGVGLITSGSLGALLGINYSSLPIEISVRLLLSVMFIVVGCVLILKKGSDL